MKWILAIFLFISIGAIAQPRPDDSTKYIWYQNQYGLRQPRIASDSFNLIPYGDTTGRRPYRNGAIMMYNGNGKIYKWNVGSGWNLSSGSSDTFGIQDNISNVDRYVNMKNHHFTIDSTSELDWWFKDADYHSEIYGSKNFMQHFIANLTTGSSSEVSNDDSTVYFRAQGVLAPHQTATDVNVAPGIVRVHSYTASSADTVTKLIIHPPAIVAPDSLLAKHNDTVKAVSVSDLASMVSATPGLPLNSIQYDSAGHFAGDSLQYYPAQKKLLTSRDYIQYGRPVTGFYQDSLWNNTTGRLWEIYPRGSEGTGADTLQKFYSEMGNTLYDITQPENPVYTAFAFGAHGDRKPYAAVRLEQDYYNHTEYHAFVTKSRNMPNPNNETRNWSWFVSQIDGSANLTTRSSDNRWNFSIENSPYYDREYAVLDNNHFKLYGINNPTVIGAYGGSLQQYFMAMNVDTTSGGIATLGTSGVSLLQLGSSNDLLISNPGLTSGVIQANKHIVANGKQFESYNLANNATAYDAISSAVGQIWKVNADGNGYVNMYTDGSLVMNSAAAGFGTSDKMINVYRNYNTGDSLFSLRANGDVHIKGLMSAKADSSATVTGGILFKDAATNDFRVASKGSILGILDKKYTAVGNSGASETDLYTYTLPANTLTDNGQSIDFKIFGTLEDATSTANLKVYFAGTSFGATGAQTVSVTSSWTATGSIIRTGTTTAHAEVTFSAPGTAAVTTITYLDMTGLDFTGTNVFKITGTAGGAGGGTDDIKARSWVLNFVPN